MTLWFLDKGKAGTAREDTVLFIDARQTFRQIDRAHRDFLPEQIELLANIVRLYRGEAAEAVDGSEALLMEHFPDNTYVDVAGLCKVATRAEIEARGWKLNPSYYVASALTTPTNYEAAAQFIALHERFTLLSAQVDAQQATLVHVLDEVAQTMEF